MEPSLRAFVSMLMKSQYCPLTTAVQVINTYFDNGDIPIGTLRPLTNETFSDSFSFT